MKKFKIRKILIPLIIIVASLFIVYEVGDKSNDKTKLHNKGYNESETQYIIDNTSKDELDYILKNKYNSNILKLLKSEDYKKEELSKYIEYLNDNISVENTIYFVNNNIEYNDKISQLLEEKYYKESNLERYLDYSSKNTSLTAKEIVTNVNCNRDHDYYTQIEETDLSKGYLIITNKYYRLKEDYKNNNMVAMNLTYSYTGHSADKLVYDYFKKMVDAASKEGIKIKNKSSYRSYYDQRYIYNNYVKDEGEENANKYSSKPGHSEHQTGLAIDVMTLDVEFIKEDSKEYNWLIDNCYKYGFILRYPKGKEDLTGYMFEPWHYRYVGIEVATYIHENDITFEEYYEYFLK